MRTIRRTGEFPTGWLFIPPQPSIISTPIHHLNALYGRPLIDSEPCTLAPWTVGVSQSAHTRIYYYIEYFLCQWERASLLSSRGRESSFCCFLIHCRRVVRAVFGAVGLFNKSVYSTKNKKNRFIHHKRWLFIPPTGKGERLLPSSLPSLTLCNTLTHCITKTRVPTITRRPTPLSP